ncbi:exodeoxyribonuclease VII large subunit [Arcanobacterium wilhelmae]|uniref:Exodeoxyribonuclease 7 large subunit n=1 Tax=Arcanobacterium wilhelmae TaxID=1803177 RepID=A0ABT9NC25_9ACTO|nr:exodeoxyribonuclease VII large subunit [Arcanobacterium wilhelmae]MDP9801259.1 exodeoxyribonuclease VII large subunit [Arcanobacterium wilhelmae]WFN90605.1 exodeoxyribonuclease VII large subunit [Arcanobacterium wilhelmae]
MKYPVPADLPQTAAATTPERPWPLALLNKKIEEYVSAMSMMWVEGEITEFVRRPGSKVQFLTLTDLYEKASITVKIFSHALAPTVEVGQHVVVQAKPDFYKVNGSLSLFAQEIRQVGLGDLLARIEALKAKLAAEGLFDARRKKPLPFLPAKIGLICGRNAKAKHDVLENTYNRWPDAQFEIREVAVQGTNAVAEIIPALEELDADPTVSVIIITRGGGSVEDLLPFSDETLARAVAAAHTPIVSAIGHETDSPILDLVADFRASTPTDAAKNVVPDVGELRQDLAVGLRRGRLAIDRLLDGATNEISTLRSRPVMATPEHMVDAREEDISGLREWAAQYINGYVETRRADISAITRQLRTLSPLSTLNRGYAVLRTHEGHIVRSPRDVTPGESLTATLAEGSLDLTSSTHPHK